jgi:hypothetical protein
MSQAAPLFSVQLTQGEIDAWRRREPLTVSQWAEQYRISSPTARKRAPGATGSRPTWWSPWTPGACLTYAR